MTLHRINEEFVLAVSIFKWLCLATLIGGMGGLSTTLFLYLLDRGLTFASQLPYLIWVLPFGMAISAWITTILVPETEGHGTDRVIQAIHQNQGEIRPAVVPGKLLATLMTILAGGSVGNIGPCAQIASGLSSLFAGIFRFNTEDRKKMVICGLSAGFAAVFGTPIAGALFGAEVLFVGRFLYSVFFPSVIASVVACHVSTLLRAPRFPIPNFSEADLSPASFLGFILSGFLFGLIALLFIETLNYTKRLVSLSGLRGPWKGFCGGFLLLGGALVFSPQFLGLGHDLLQQALQGQNILWYAFLIKILSTSLTLNFGGSGGILLPLVIVGAMGGSFYAQALDLNPATFAALGFAGVLAGAANIPLTAIILSIELFGTSIGPFAGIACTISYLLTGHRSIIPTQLVESGKSSSLRLDLGKEIQHIDVHISPRDKTLTQATLKIWQRFKQRHTKDI